MQNVTFTPTFVQTCFNLRQVHSVLFPRILWPKQSGVKPEIFRVIDDLLYFLSSGYQLLLEPVRQLTCRNGPDGVQQRPSRLTVGRPSSQQTSQQRHVHSFLPEVVNRSFRWNLKSTLIKFRVFFKVYCSFFKHGISFFNHLYGDP